MSSPTARSLELLREMKFQCQVVESFNHFTKQRKDLFGIIDILAVHETLGILGVQTTTGSNHSARFKKACKAPLHKWFRAGAHMAIWSWSKRGKQGERKLWTVRVQQVVLEDLIDETRTMEADESSQ